MSHLSNSFAAASLINLLLFLAFLHDLSEMQRKKFVFSLCAPAVNRLHRAGFTPFDTLKTITTTDLCALKLLLSWSSSTILKSDFVIRTSRYLCRWKFVSRNWITHVRSRCEAQIRTIWSQKICLCETEVVKEVSTLHTFAHWNIGWMI